MASFATASKAAARTLRQEQFIEALTPLNRKAKKTKPSQTAEYNEIGGLTTKNPELTLKNTIFMVVAIGEEMTVEDQNELFGSSQNFIDFKNDMGKKGNKHARPGGSSSFNWKELVREFVEEKNAKNAGQILDANKIIAYYENIIDKPNRTPSPSRSPSALGKKKKKTKKKKKKKNKKKGGGKSKRRSRRKSRRKSKRKKKLN
tara:strand:+ start:109 stop:717 length:609 start_codon:yes stop_codon:yes gene_type:complete